MWLVIGGVLLLLGGAVWFERQKIEAQLRAQGWVPVPPGPPAPMPVAPAGVVPTTPDPAGGVLVTLVPGNMGTLKVTGANAFPPPGVAVQVQPPTQMGPGIGAILGITSSNPSAVSASGSLVNPGQLGQMSAPLQVMGPGTANISVSWNDGAKAQTTTFTVVAS